MSQRNKSKFNMDSKNEDSKSNFFKSYNNKSKKENSNFTPVVNKTYDRNFNFDNNENEVKDYKQFKNNYKRGEYKNKVRNNYEGQKNKYDKKDPETIEGIEQILNCGKYLHQSKREELEQKLNNLKYQMSPEVQYPTLASDVAVKPLSKNNVWAKTNESSVKSDKGVKEANEKAIKLYREEMKRQQIEKLEREQQRKLKKLQKYDSDDEYNGNDFFDDQTEEVCDNPPDISEEYEDNIDL